MFTPFFGQSHYLLHLNTKNSENTVVCQSHILPKRWIGAKQNWKKKKMSSQILHLSYRSRHYLRVTLLPRRQACTLILLEILRWKTYKLTIFLVCKFVMKLYLFNLKQALCCFIILLMYPQASFPPVTQKTGAFIL